MKTGCNFIIGNEIQNVVFTKNFSLSELSEKLCIPIPEILKTFNSKNIDLILLYKWSCLLKYDFFVLYSNLFND